jgi:hypothetical protein
MPLFKKRSEEDPIKAIEAGLAEARGRGADITNRLKAAEQAAAEARRAVEEAAASGAPDAELDVTEAAMRAREDRTRTLVAALAAVDDNVTSLEADLAAAVKQRQANQVSAELAKMADAIGKAAPERFRATNAIIAAIRSSTVSTSETTRVANYLAETENQVGEAISLLLAELRSSAESVRAGAVPFRLEGPATPIEAPSAPIATVRAYVLDRGIRWTQDREVRTAGKFSAVDLPAALLPIARAHNVVDAWSADRAVRYRATQGTFFDKPLDGPELVDLDLLVEQDVAGEVTPEAAE